MKNTLENFIRCELSYAKKCTDRNNVNAHFHNAYGATCFVLNIAETEEDYNAIMRMWDDYKEEFENLMWGEN